MIPRRPPAPRGLTLVELLVALVVSTLVIAGAMVLLSAQQRAHTSSSGQRALQETARIALADLGRNLRDAGYGLEPAMVLDFGPQNGVKRKGLYGWGFQSLTTYQCADPVTCRDRTDGPDEIVFYRRDPLFSRAATSVTTAVLGLRGDLKEPLRAGQVLQVMCIGGERTVAHVTVAENVAAKDPPYNPNGNVSVRLAPGRTGAGGAPAFPFENDQLAAPCFADAATPGQVMTTKIDRFRYYVETYDDAGAVVVAQTPGSRPYLMLDQGLSDENGVPMVTPVAPDVEDLQVAYLMPPAPGGGSTTVVGATLGEGIGSGPRGITVGVPPPSLGDAPDALSRQTGNPANTLGVRLGVVVRTPDSDINLMNNLDPNRTVPSTCNRDAFLGLPGFRRALFETTVHLKNMRAGGIVFPVLDPTGTEPGTLVGGG